MATADVIQIPSSSPPRVFARSQTPVPLSSSPALPSLRQLLGLKDGKEGDGKAKETTFKTALKTRDGFPGFQKASSLIAKQSVVGGEDTKPPEGKTIETDKENTESKKKPKAKKVATDDTGAVSSKHKKTKKRKSDEASLVDEGAGNPINLQVGVEEAPKKKKSRKSTTKKSSTESQPLLEEGKETKATAGGEDESNTGALREKASKKSKKKESTVLPGVEGKDQDLQLDRAPTRRNSWTPLKNTFAELRDEEEEECMPPKTTNFAQLTGSFGYTSGSSKTNGKEENNDSALTRRPIELIATRVKSAKVVKKSKLPKEPKPPKEKKTKSPTKKPVTITARATSNYFGDVGEDEPAPILQYLQQKNDSVPISIHDELSAPRKIPKALKPKAKRKSQPSFKKANVPPSLLPPDSAIQNLGHQDFFFGTSTQLATDDSPTFIKDTQHALELSESQDPFDDFAFDKISGLSVTLQKSTSLLPASKSLWSAAARDVEDTYIDAEVLNLVDTPAPKKSIPPAPAQPREKPVSKPSSQPPAASQSKPIPQSPVVHIAQTTSLPPVSTSTQKSPSKSPSKRSHKRTTSATLRKKESPRKPHYDGFTDTELTAQIIKYGFKSAKVKRRENKIALLNQCWDEIQARRNGETMGQLPPLAGSPPPPTIEQPPEPSATEADTSVTQPSKKTLKSKARTKATPTTLPPTQPEPSTADRVAAATPKPKKRGRPKKVPSSSQTLTSTTATSRLSSPPPKPKRKRRLIDEISDTEGPTPSPPRPRSLSALPLSTSTTPTKTTKAPSKTTAPPEPTTNPPPTAPLPSAQSINLAIISQPPHPNSPHTHPTFHAQILSFQPVSIEALTVWLNTDGLRRAGEDGEVNSVLVRAWLEERGICCLWDGNGGRGRRGRKGR